MCIGEAPPFGVDAKLVLSPASTETHRYRRVAKATEMISAHRDSNCTVRPGWHLAVQCRGSLVRFKQQGKQRKPRRGTVPDDNEDLDLDVPFNLSLVATVESTRRKQLVKGIVS
jgi:hypothetical protein